MGATARARIASLLLGCLFTAVLAGCGNEAFPPFLQQFVSDKTFQLEHIRYPLAVRIGADPPAGLGEPIHEQWSKEKVKALEEPLILGPEQRRKENVEETVTPISPGRVRVNHFMPESDAYLLEYEFVNVEGCWYLARIEDVSL